MKRLFSAVAALLLLMPPGAAVALTPGEPAGKDVKAVYEKITGSPVHAAPLTGGTASVTAGGTTVSVSAADGALPPGSELVVRFIAAEDAEAYEWFTGVLSGKGTGFLPFEIFFRNGNVRTEPGGQVQISVALPNGITNPAVWYISPAGDIAAASLSVSSGRISFAYSGGDYYALGSAAGTSSADSGGTPGTGDGLLPAVCGITLLAAGLAACAAFAKRQRRG